MATYRVVVSRNLVEYASLYIEADSQLHAKNQALTMLREDEIEDWCDSIKTKHQVLQIEEED